MKKYLCLFVTCVLLFTSTSAIVTATNDATDLGYKLNFVVSDVNGAEIDTFQIGDTIRMKFSLDYSGAGRAAVYGLQGEIYFDSYVIRRASIVEKNNISVREKNGQITFAFLDMSGQGKTDAMLGNIGEIVFTAKSNGTVNLYGDKFIVTNRDATERYVDTSEIASLIIGTGVKDVTKELLENDIIVAEGMLADCTVTDDTTPQIYYPEFWITTETERAFQLAIDNAKSIFEKDDVSSAEIETAVADLSEAVKAFERSKIFGPRRWSANSYVKVNVSVDGGNGKIHPDFVALECRLNTSCTVRMIPNEGYETEYVYVNGEMFAGSDIFTIPNVTRETTVSAVFCKIPPFTDILHDDWFYVGVRYAYNNSLFQGMSETEFSPELAMNRAMLVTVLYRMEGQPKVAFSDNFSDVKNGMWYTDAIAWASENNIAAGYGDGIFAPNDFITREQMAVMLHRYTTGKGKVSDEGTETLNYTDVSEISDYALKAVKWAVSEGLIKGNTETTINPLGKATRAEVATILMRYMEML